MTNTDDSGPGRIPGATDEHYVWLYTELKGFVQAELDRDHGRAKDGMTGYLDGKILAMESVLSFARGMEGALARRVGDGAL